MMDDADLDAEVLLLGDRDPSAEEELLGDGDDFSIASGPAYTYDEALEKIGVGRFQWLLLLLCGWANASDAVEILAVSFILPAAQADLALTDTRKGYLSSAIFIGMMFGGYLWGTLADRFGRRTCLVTAMTVNAAFGAASALAPSFAAIVICRFVSGLGVGGSIPVVFAYFCEFLPPSVRGQWMAYLAAFWMLGSILCAGTAWILIPGPGWRVFILVSALPSAISAVGMWLAAESPRYLLVTKNSLEAEKVLMRIDRMNNKGTSAPTTGLKLQAPTATPPVSLAALFSRTQRVLTLRLAVLWGTLCYGFYGVSMWLPQYFADVPQTDIYFSTFAVALANVPGNVVSAVMVDRVGRTRTLALAMGLAGGSMLALPFASTGGEILAVSCVFNGVAVAGWNSLDIVSAELFPTAIRSTGFGFLTAIGRVAAVAANQTFGLLFHVNAAIPLVISAVLMLVGGLSALALPNTTQRALH